ncbi:Stp1/IreP family PP2C-type Ser/Thr phosphatase [Pajaroellobacter abortibovis]|uniref:Serine/threonine protein phosphatase n=1 Tax=Pajaroellobacter abortibovis TaxID=1882918 RepID=A0A1L6MZQ6_9BACT|nr:serine/threonine protein phosphatase [Pajaroellobacter abortibovis]
MQKVVVSNSARVEVVADTHVGIKRTHNEDSFAVVQEAGLYMITDGMGGHASGEIASQMAIEVVHDFFKATASDPNRTWPYKMDRTKAYEENRLSAAIRLANLHIYERAQRDPQRHGMGTTIVAMLSAYNGMYIAHVGDSRVYRIRNHQIQRLTEDHSLLNDYIKMNLIKEEEIALFPHKNVIVRALGMKETVHVDTCFDRSETNDIYLLCSDGLSGPVSDEELLHIVDSTSYLTYAVSHLIERANKKGGPDNITAILVRRLE